MQTSLPYKMEGQVLNWGRCLCGTCGKKGKLGSSVRPTPQRPVARVVCFDCTIEDLSRKNNISSKDAKKKLERHQKTQTYLTKVILKRYQEETGKKPSKKFDELAALLQPGLGWWEGLSEKEKDDIAEKSEDDQEIFFKTAPILPTSQKPVVRENHTGRNDPCPCGSGKKYKKCCLN